MWSFLTWLEVEVCDWSPDDALMLTCGGRLDHLVYVWDTAVGSNVARLAAHEGSVTAVAWSPTGAQFLSASVDQVYVGG